VIGRKHSFPLRWLGHCALAWIDPASVVARLSSLDWQPI
jgi:hypothetical protein